MNSGQHYWKVSDALFPWFPAKLGFCTIVASNSILTGNEGMPNVCVCSIPFLSYFWYLVVDLMTYVTCNATHTASLFMLADIFSALVWFMFECLPDPWAGAGNTPSVLFGILGEKPSISNALCFAQKEKIQCNPEPDSVTCHHLQTLSWEEGHKVRSFLFWDHRNKREDMTISIKILPDFIKIVVIKNFCKLSSDLRMPMPLSKRNKRKHSMTFNN